jgi:hypothetical protein
MGWQRPRPTTRRSERVLVVKNHGNWSTHIVIGTAGLTVIRIVMLRWWMRIRVFRVHVFVGWVNEAGWVSWFEDSALCGRIVCWVVGWVWGDVVYGCSRWWGKVIRFREEARFVDMNGGRTGAVVRTVAASGVIFTWQVLVL